MASVPHTSLAKNAESGQKITLTRTPARVEHQEPLAFSNRILELSEALLLPLKHRLKIDLQIHRFRNDRFRSLRFCRASSPSSQHPVALEPRAIGQPQISAVPQHPETHRTTRTSSSHRRSARCNQALLLRRKTRP